MRLFRTRTLCCVTETQSPEAQPIVADALAAAGIPVPKLGACRGERLSPAERALYVWILGRFALGENPSAGVVRDEAARLRLDFNRIREKLASEDLIHFDAEGRIAVAYPFSGHPTPHRVSIDGHEAYAMCAIDALGIAPMLGLSIEIISHDPITSSEINVLLDADGTGTWRPQEAVVVAGRACDGAAFQGCCQVLNFFASLESAQQYLGEREDVSGFPITMPQAIELGRVIFGDVLRAR